MCLGLCFRLHVPLAEVRTVSLGEAVGISHGLNELIDTNKLVLEGLDGFGGRSSAIVAADHCTELLDVTCLVTGELHKLIYLWVKQAKVKLEITEH